MVQPLAHNWTTLGGAPRRLLIVQHYAFARRSLERYFNATFGEVLTAASPVEAEALLKDPQRPPTDLICGQYFGDDTPLGTELIPRWRSLCPTLRRVALVTASEALSSIPEEIDAVFEKPVDPGVLLSFFAHVDPQSGPVQTHGSSL